MTDLKSRNVLKRAAQVIAEPERWCKSQMARNSDGNPVEPESPNAVCFCAFGAIRRAYLELDMVVEASCLRLVESEAMRLAAPGGFGFLHFNDKSTHKEVLEMFETAIDYVEERGL